MNNIYRQAEFLVSAHTLAQLPPDQGREVAFAGRSNSGKSSVINTITERKALARTSKTPGRTRLINFFTLGDEQRLVDLPGYGFARVPSKLKLHWGVVLSDYIAGRQSLQGLILIADIRRELTDYDRQMMDWCQAAGLPVHVLLNKADKLSKNAAKQVLLKIQQELGPDSGHSVQLFSAMKRSGADEARLVLDGWIYPDPDSTAEAKKGWPR